MIQIVRRPICHYCGALSPSTISVLLTIRAAIRVPTTPIQSCARALTDLQRDRVPDSPENRSCADVDLLAFEWIRQAGNSYRSCPCTFVSIFECTLATIDSILKRVNQYK